MTQAEIAALLKFAKELNRRAEALRLGPTELSRRTVANRAKAISAGYISDILRVGRGDSSKEFRVQRDKVIRLARAVEWDEDEALDFAGFKSAERARVDTIEEALNSTPFFDLKGLSENDKAILRPLLEVADREVERLRSQSARNQPSRALTSKIRSIPRKRDKIDEIIDTALGFHGKPVSEVDRKTIREILEKQAAEKLDKDE